VNAVYLSDQPAATCKDRHNTYVF